MEKQPHWPFHQLLVLYREKKYDEANSKYLHPQLMPVSSLQMEKQPVF